MSLRRFTSVKNLRGLGRPLLGRFFERFKSQLEANGVVLPAENLDDTEYFDALVEVFFAPDKLPQQMLEALDMISEMANEPGCERLQRAAQSQPKLDLKWETQSSDLDIAMQVWLADAGLFTQSYSEHRLVMLTSFQHFGTKTLPADRLPFTPPTQAVLNLVRDRLDEWCAKNNRGAETVAITTRQMDGEWWFLIQHGDTWRRAPKVEKRKVEILNYRPGKDDVVVYSPARDEIRLHASANGERRKYREQFSTCLRGDPDYFSEEKSFTLQPLRDNAEKALTPVPGIKRITLRELGVQFGGSFNDSILKKSDDMLASAADRNKRTGAARTAIPESGDLVSAVFEIEFEGVKKPRRVSLRPGTNGLSVGRVGDMRLVLEWLAARGFRDATEEPQMFGRNRRFRPTSAIRHEPPPDEKPVTDIILPPDGAEKGFDGRDVALP